MVFWLGINNDPDKFEKIDCWLTPSTSDAVHGFFRLTFYCHQLIPEFHL